MRDSEKEKTNSDSAPPGTLNKLPTKFFNLTDFELKTFQGEKVIIFHITENDDLTGTIYKAELELQELYELSRLFRQFISIEEAFTLFFRQLDDSKIMIKKEENKINLIIIVDFLGQKNEVKIILSPEEPNIENVVSKLCDKAKEIDSLNKIINKQKIKIESQQKELNDFKANTEKKIKELEDNFNEMLKFNIEHNNLEYLNAEEIIKAKERIAKFKETINSHIMKYNELNLIKTGIKNKLDKKIKKWTLIFRASENGYKAEDFHNICDGRKNTVVLVKTKTGRRFGGFSDTQWSQNGSYNSSSYGFIFSFDNNDIYYNRNSTYSIYCVSGYGPYFGSDFYISNNCNESQSYESLGSYYENNGKKYPLTGYSNFLIKDYEIYQLELE